METLRSDNPVIAAPEVLQEQRPLGGDRGRSPRRSWFTDWVLERRSTGKNVLAVLTGELGIGKSYMGLELCRHFDPSFSADKVVFLGSDFMKAVNAAKPGSWILFDEPNLGIGHRTFMNIVNRTVAGFVQASRFLMVNAIFALPSADLMDTAVVRVAHIRIRVTARGWGKVERIKHNEFEGGPRIRFKGMGAIKVPLPPAYLTKPYELKRKEFHTTFFQEEALAEAEKASVVTVKKKSDQRVELVLAHIEDYKDPNSGEVSPSRIARAFGLQNGAGLANKVRFELESRKQPLNQS